VTNGSNRRRGGSRRDPVMPAEEGPDLCGSVDQVGGRTDEVGGQFAGALARPPRPPGKGNNAPLSMHFIIDIP
jgi:hypothetical protein